MNLLKRGLSIAKESYMEIIPIVFLVMVLAIFLHIPILKIYSFLLGGFLLIIGKSLFSLGAKVGIELFGKRVGTSLGKRGNIVIFVITIFLIGFVLTLSEPDLLVLAGELPSIPKSVLVICVSISVGIFLVLGMLKSIYRLNFNTLILISYGIIFLLMLFVPSSFYAIGFDAGGATTGPISVPFIVALGLGLSSLRTDKDAKKDGFGSLALCSIGPVMIVLILGLFYNTDSFYDISSITTSNSVYGLYFNSFISSFGEVFITLFPFIVLFLVYGFIAKCFSKRDIKRIVVGFVLVLLGFSIFLVGTSVGFISMGYLLGESLSMRGLAYLSIPIGTILGYLIVSAEPAVNLLNEQIDNITSGSIKRKSVRKCLSLAVGIAVGISFYRAITGFSIAPIIVIGYIICIILSFFVNRLFTGISFDAGGAVSGPLTVSFLLPMAIGITYSLGGNIMTDAFGLVALVTLLPIVVIQIFGLVYRFKSKILGTYDSYDDSIRDYNWRKYL